MKTQRISSLLAAGLTVRTKCLLLALSVLVSSGARAAVAPLLLDDYSNATRNRNGLERLLIDDKMVGSSSKASQRCTNGVLMVRGDLVPGRGVPAFISQVSLLSPDGKPKDLTGYQGVRLRVKVLKGILCVQVASAVVTNFDYHAGAPIVGQRGEFQEVRVAFKDMKRSWSEQTALDLKSLVSVNLISFGMAKDAFAYEVDELGFY
ncbi:MAG: CIA30 family protein [Verrucomicrobiales bacterium]|nr:CIA30 family protein [Verrucomicrobiales bacterium]